MALVENTLSLDGLTAHYWEDGQDNGRVLLLIHGGLGDARLHWGGIMPALAEEFRVLAPDLPGFGDSDPLPVLRLNTLLHWLKTFLDQLNIEQAVVVGSSLGGLFARLFAAANPQLVPALILVNGGGVPDIPPALRLLERIPGLSGLMLGQFVRSMTDLRNLQKMVHASDVLTDEFIARSRAANRSFARAMRMLVTGPLPEARNPMIPTLVMWGVNDSFTPLADGEAVRDSIPGAVLTEITDCGHLPQLETPDVFVWQVSNFLDKLSRPQRDNLPGVDFLPPAPG